MHTIIRSKETSQNAVATGSKRNKWGYLKNIRLKNQQAFQEWKVGISERQNSWAWNEQTFRGE
jgi:hypothetical protein